LFITNGKKGDNIDILKLQKSFIWLFFNNSFHELGDEACLLGMATNSYKIAFRIQQYFDIMDYVDSLYGQ
jgi:hypothetical protein